MYTCPMIGMATVFADGRSPRTQIICQHACFTHFHDLLRHIGMAHDQCAALYIMDVNLDYVTGVPCGYECAGISIIRDLSGNPCYIKVRRRQDGEFCAWLQMLKMPEYAKLTELRESWQVRKTNVSGFTLTDMHHYPGPVQAPVQFSYR